MQKSETFRVSEETVALARGCRKLLPEEELPMLDLSSTRAPSPDKGFNMDIAREAIGERLLRLVGTIARWEATINPQSKSVTFAYPDQGKKIAFIEKARKGIAEECGLNPEHPSFPLFLEKLAEDLHAWIPRNDMGINQDPHGSLSCTCPDLSPTLEPLEEDHKTP